MYEHQKSTEYKRGQLVQAAFSVTSVYCPKINREFKRQLNNTCFKGLDLDLSPAQLVGVAAAVIFAAEGFVPEDCNYVVEDEEKAK